MLHLYVFTLNMHVMEANRLPDYDMNDNPTGCCPKFKPEGWEDQELHFKNKPFVKVKTQSFFHMPINMGQVFLRTSKAIEKAGAMDDHQFIVLTDDQSAWSSDHYFAVTKDVPGEEMVYLDGDYITKVFEGPYKNAPKWYDEMKHYVEHKGRKTEKVYFFYTTCPKCAKVYGKNYVVAVAREG